MPVFRRIGLLILVEFQNTVPIFREKSVTVFMWQRRGHADCSYF